MYKQYLTAEQAFQKVKHFCSYQERCHAEVKEKLYSFGLNKQDVELLMSRLIEADYLNEERYAWQFAGGKFRVKQWGRVKIKYELKQNKISDYLIKKAFKAIEEADYIKTLQKLATVKWKSLKNDQYIHRQIKTTNYLLQKGFEINLIQEAINNIKSKN